METAWPEILTTHHLRILDPSLQGHARRFSDLETDRLARFAMCDRSTLFDTPRSVNIVHSQADQIATSELAIDGHVKQREITPIVCHFQTDTDGPDMFGKKWALLADNAPLVPRGARGTNGG